MQRCDLDPNILCKNAGVEMCYMPHNEVPSHSRSENHGNTRKTQKNYYKLCTNPIQLFCSYPLRGMVFHSFLSQLSQWIVGGPIFVTFNGITNKSIFSLLFLEQRY